MTCPRCQAENRDGRDSARSVRRRWPLACPVLRVSNEPGKRVLRRVRRTSRRRPSRPPQPVRAPESYTPKHLAEKILTSKAALEGERKQVTVLFADLKGSMELLADRDPEEARKLLDPVLERMMEAVHHYEGTVNQVMGDGIMALFGAPIGPRGPRGARLLCRAADAAAGQPLRGRDPAAGRDAGADPRGRQLRRGGRARHRQRPPHGLHRRRADDPSRRPDGADGEARVGADHRRHPEAGRGLRPGPTARGGSGEGARDPDAGLRADRGRAGPVPAPGQRRARPDPLRRARPGAGAARAGARARRGGPRAGGRRRGRGRRGEVAARLGVHAVAPHPRLAGARERLGLLREGDAVPARHRAAEGVLPDPGARRPASHPRDAWPASS